MAFRRTEEDGVLPGPWGGSPREGDPSWGWVGDEETLPLLSPTDHGLGTEGQGQVCARPWDQGLVNVTEESLWLPLQEPLLEQENQLNEHVMVETPL